MKPKPEIKVLDIVDNPNGSSLITFETNEAFDQMYLKKTGKQLILLVKKGVLCLQSVL